MKVTNDMIDKVAEVCMDIALKTGSYYEDAMREFLRDYLGVLFTPLSTIPTKIKEAKILKTHEQWQDAYRRFCRMVYGEDTPGAARPENGTFMGPDELAGAPGIRSAGG